MHVDELADTFSKLKFFCLGIVTAHKEENSDIIRVNLRETSTMANGALDTQKTEYDLQAPDARGLHQPAKQNLHLAKH